MRRSELFEEVADVVGFEFNSCSNEQRFSHEEIQEICEYLGLDAEGENYKLRRRLIQYCDLNRRITNYTSPSAFNQGNVEKILEEVRKKEKTRDENSGVEQHA